MPIMQILAQLNWIDVVVLMTVIFLTIRGSKSGFMIEFFKLSGMILGIYLSLHYFSRVSDSLLERFSVPGMVFLDFASFLVLAILGYLTAVILREVFARLIKTEAATVLNRWGGLILGSLRGIVTAGMLLLVLYFSGVHYLRSSINKSYSAGKLMAMDIKVYEFIFNGIATRFTPSEEINTENINEVLQESPTGEESI